MSVFLFTADIIRAIAVLFGYGILLSVRPMHITLPKTRVMLLPPPTILAMSVIHLPIN